MGHLHTHSPTNHPDSACTPSLTEIASLNRDELIDRLLHFQGSCPLDFSEAFLSSKSTDKLRHILMAACKHAGRWRS